MLNFIVILTLFITSLYLLALWPETSRREQMKLYRGTMFAHRGYHCLEKGIPENSLAAFRAALKKGYGIELDVRLTADERLIVFHDDTLERVCQRAEVPEEMRASQLKGCTLFHTSEHIPLLEEALALIAGRVPLLIELKTPDRSMRICEKTCALLKAYPGTYLIQSFDPKALQWFREQAPSVLRGQLSCDLTKEAHASSWLSRFLLKHLFTNFLSRPDFISYRLSDLPTLNTVLLHKFWGVPFAVWTLKDRKELKEGIRHYDMQIFEKSCENY